MVMLQQLFQGHQNRKMLSSLCATRIRTVPTISKTSFVIAVPDLKRSAAFYRDVLGFTVHTIPDPGWLFYTSGDCKIMAAQCPNAIPPRKLGDHSYFAYLEIDEIDSFYASVLASQAEICKTIRDEPWGMREFGLVTIDGHPDHVRCSKVGVPRR
jgi:catechol 2,3-dioxygenase-like lactoylglutathione lyase family enzyme